MKSAIEKIKTVIRGIMSEVAKLLDMMTNGFIRPWHVSAVSFFGHVVVLLALSEAMFTEAAVLLIGFGLLDALDGAVARHQGSASTRGMLLDSTSDRLKEALIYAGLAYYFATITSPLGALYSALALGLSVSVSYVKAKGEVSLLEQAQAKDKKIKNINREFGAGIFSYEVRMFVLVVALLAHQPLYGVLVVAGGSLLTFAARFHEVATRLDDKN